MKKVLVMVEITIDEDNIATLYPNYNINWDDVDDFIEATIDNLQTPFEENEIPIEHLKKYGYSIRVLSRDESKLKEDVENLLFRYAEQHGLTSTKGEIDEFNDWIKENL